MTSFRIQDLHDELEQLFETSNDVQDVLADNFNMPPIDDEELADQLELLGEEFTADTDTSYLDEATAGGISVSFASSAEPQGPITPDTPNHPPSFSDPVCT
jgi:hypothetical protein